jgi:hypothetical protein
MLRDLEPEWVCSVVLFVGYCNMKWLAAECVRVDGRPEFDGELGEE